jgi:predicted amidophosphoribosyltransferase
MNAIDELLDLLLPTRCALCGTLGSSMCNDCSADFELDAREVSREHLHGWVATSFGVKEQKVLHAFKENGQTSLTGFIAAPVAALFAGWSNHAESPILVPVPSSRENYKKRGFMPTRLLAKRICNTYGHGSAVLESLIFGRSVADQASLSSESRRANLAGSMSVDSRVSGRRVVLFDDVITTGSTILEADRAVTQAGGIVLGFLGFAETILKTASKN